ncbi:2-hydroxyacid dehydrogenase [Streptomyces sp. A7024]|uniref:2-hydroxyacid dehydrogenase n=1 Tax=Streptomyces coryli TaxID=1128680 RepID=A0A6G4UAL9_9ACTN|nr:2-hydroxyacid dehydrogenase [Streptomyces coryli]
MWLALPPEEIDGLPDSLDYVYWDGAGEWPADPADCVFYVPPYMTKPDITTAPMLRMPRLKAIQTLTAGVDAYLPAVRELPPGVTLCNARGVHEASTAELALTLTLASLRGIPQFVRRQDRQEWKSGFHPSLADKTVLILGYGAIGAAVEDRLAGFECARVIRVARSSRATPRGPVHSTNELPTLLPDSDVVIVVTPLTEDTRGLVDDAFLARMKDGALLVNVARGAVVDTKALVSEVESGRLRAALDVTDPEPLPVGHPLWSAPGVLISPHTGGPTSAFRPRAAKLLAAQLRRFAAGQPLEHVVAVS